MLAPPPLPRTVEASFRDLSSTRPEARASSIEDLVRHAVRDSTVRERAIPLLQQALSDDVAGVRSAAAVGLADLKATEALPALLVAIEDQDGHVRQMALNALGEIGDPRAAPRLLRALSDARPEVRYQALIAYSRVAPDPLDVGKALASGLADADESVQYIALRVAEERSDAGITAGLEAVVARAETLLAKPPGHLALAAAIFLAKRGSPTALAVIREVVEGTFRARGGPAKEDEREAVELAGVLGLKDAIPALERRAFGFTRHVRDTCAYHATIALARMGHPRAKDELLRDLDSARRATREAAVVAIGRAHLEEARPRLARLTREDVDPDLLAQALASLAPSEVTP
jgi:HEAT repeat protein